jgi:fucose permease
MLFSITVEERPERANELSGLMCMAISGGALVPLVMGKLLDLKMGALAYLVPTVCFAYLLLLSLKGGGKPGQAPIVLGGSSGQDKPSTAQGKGNV